MQHKLYSSCIHPTPLDLNEHLVFRPLASDCSTPYDDVEIATGQAGFDDGELYSNMDSWIVPRHSHEMGDDSDNVSASPDLNSTQAHSAPARGWDIGGFERSDSGAGLQYEGSSLIKENEPWSHLQTFALSAPGHDDQRSRDIQIEAISQWPSSVQGNEMIHHSMTQSRDQRQAPMDQKMMPEHPYSPEADCTGHLRHHYQADSARSPHPADFGTFGHRSLSAGEQQIAGSSTSSSFSQPATSGLHTDSNPAQFFDYRSAYPLQHPHSNQMKGSYTRPRQDLENDYSLAWGPVDGAGLGSLPNSHYVLSSQNLSWQQHSPPVFGNGLSASADTVYRSYDFGLTADDHARSSDSIYDPVFGGAKSYIDNETCTLDHPDAIKIERPGGRYKLGPQSCVPPSEDSFQDWMPIMQEDREYREIASNFQPTVSSFSLPNLSHRKNSNKSTSARVSRSDSLSVIQESGQSQHGNPNLSRNGSAKGRRNGPLSTATALAAARKRKDGNVCIRCRTMKMTCKGGLPCEGCRQITKAKLWDQSCTPANFTDVVKEDTCNAVFQRSISHLALDGNRRLTVAVPTAFNVPELLDRLDSCRGRYDIQVQHWSGSSYILDVSDCFKTLTRMHKSCGLETCGLQDFVKNKQVRSAWLQCVRGCDLAASLVDRSIELNNMPSRNSYEVLPRNTLVLGKSLDVEDEEDRGTIVFAVQLCRIILRALEVEAFEALQKSVNELTKGGKSDADIETLIGQLGRILLSLRWRISWWSVIGDGPEERFTCRVTKLAQILYCYFFIARKKFPLSGQLPNKIRSVYADVGPVCEEFPLTDSLNGFYTWIQKGNAIVQAAKSQRNISRSFPIAPVNTHF